MTIRPPCAATARWLARVTESARYPWLPACARSARVYRGGLASSLRAAVDRLGHADGLSLTHGTPQWLWLHHALLHAPSPRGERSPQRWRWRFGGRLHPGAVARVFPKSLADAQPSRKPRLAGSAGRRANARRGKRTRPHSTLKPHGAVGHRPPAPEAIRPGLRPLVRPALRSTGRIALLLGAGRFCLS